MENVSVDSLCFVLGDLNPSGKSLRGLSLSSFNLSLMSCGLNDGQARLLGVPWVDLTSRVHVKKLEGDWSRNQAGAES